MNTSSPTFKKEMTDIFNQNKKCLEQLCKQHNANYISIDSQENYVEKLIQLFRIRKK